MQKLADRFHSTVKACNKYTTTGKIIISKGIRIVKTFEKSDVLFTILDLLYLICRYLINPWQDEKANKLASFGCFIQNLKGHN